MGAMKELLASLKMPVYVVVGNHDFTPQNDRRAYDDAFPKTLNYHFDHRGWQFLGLDTTQGFAGSNTVIAKETLDYLAATLKQLDPKRPMVLFTHFPLGWLLPSRPTNA
jgi:3',5'-cyclic AMP phosphodiesterase CpdA